jgi:hypothetical protein
MPGPKENMVPGIISIVTSFSPPFFSLHILETLPGGGGPLLPVLLDYFLI